MYVFSFVKWNINEALMDFLKEFIGMFKGLLRTATAIISPGTEENDHTTFFLDLCGRNEIIYPNKIFLKSCEMNKPTLFTYKILKRTKDSLIN